MVLAWPDVSALNLWENLPQITSFTPNVKSVDSTSPGGGVLLTASPLITSPIRIREKQVSFGVYKWWETTFKIDPAIWLAGATLAGVGARIPKPRDLVFDGVNTWTVSRATSGLHEGAPWRLICRLLVVEGLLCDTINIQKPVDSTDNYLSPLTSQGTPSGPDTNMPCRIQFEREEVEDFHGVQFFRGYYSIYVQNLDDNLVIGSVVTATAGGYNGTTFRVLSNDNIEELEELEQLTVTIDPIA